MFNTYSECLKSQLVWISDTQLFDFQTVWFSNTYLFQNVLEILTKVSRFQTPYVSKIEDT